jgi:alkenylglycerophosphocholine/alkenylglycerophosphoethanolamine hydrolase
MRFASDTLLTAFSYQPISKTEGIMSAVLALVLRREFNSLDKLLLAISAVCGLVYLLTVNFQPYQGSVMIKALSIAPLAVLAFRVLKTLDGFMLSMALVFSAIGDVMLGLHREDFFIFGLLSFLVAHLFYTGLFARNFRRPLRTDVEQKMIIVCLLTFSAAMTMWLWSGLGAMKIPALIYLCAITLMCLAATLMDLSKRTVLIGAILFLLSDSLIAANKFKTPIPLSSYAIWLTYYAGQGCIDLGFLREKLRA